MPLAFVSGSSLVDAVGKAVAENGSTRAKMTGKMEATCRSQPLSMLPLDAIALFRDGLALACGKSANDRSPLLGLLRDEPLD
jgi:hypothetical protein